MVSLVRITFRIVFISERLHCPRSVSAADTLTATALLPSRGLAKCTNDVPVNNVSRSTCDVTIESGYGDSDTSFNSVSSSCGISCHPCDFLDRTLLNGHSCKRPRCEAPGLTTNVISNSSAVHSATVTSGRVQPIATASPSRISPNKNVSGDDGEIDRRPFKSKASPTKLE